MKVVYSKQFQAELFCITGRYNASKYDILNHEKACNFLQSFLQGQSRTC